MRGKRVSHWFGIKTCERQEDVTDEVVEHMRTIYKEQFGAKWEKQQRRHKGPYDTDHFTWDDDW